MSFKKPEPEDLNSRIEIIRCNDGLYFRDRKKIDMRHDGRQKFPKLCPKCKNSNTIIFFDYFYLYEMNVEYFVPGTINIK